MCFSQPKMPTPIRQQAAINIDESAQIATEEEARRKKKAMGSASTSIAGLTNPPSTAPKTALGM